jgi:hypothetical protein
VTTHAVHQVKCKSKPCCCECSHRKTLHVWLGQHTMPADTLGHAGLHCIAFLESQLLHAAASQQLATEADQSQLASDAQLCCSIQSAQPASGAQLCCSIQSRQPASDAQLCCSIQSLCQAAIPQLLLQLQNINRCGCCSAAIPLAIIICSTSQVSRPSVQ